MKANRLSIKKKGSKMNHRGVRTAEGQESSRGITEALAVAIIGAEAIATGGKL